MMSRTLLFFVLLATFLWVSKSDDERFGMGEDVAPIRVMEGEDAATPRGKVNEDGSGNGKGNGHTGEDSNGKGHTQHGNGLGKGHGGGGEEEPPACECGPWSAWGSCSRPCGGGSQRRSRSCSGGSPCPPTYEDTDCNTRSCGGGPVNCQCGPWSPWGSCSHPCGGGSQRRERSITIQPSGGGSPCPPTYEERDCNTDSCGGGGDGGGGPGDDHDCEMSGWSSWGSCSRPCGGGSRIRTCSILRRPTGGGRPCGSTSQSGSCNSQRC